MLILKWQIAFLWLAVAAYALSGVAFVISAAFRRGRWVRPAVLLTWLGLLPHSAALALRWLQAGHGPYMYRYEVYSSDAWVAVFLFLIIQRWRPALRVLGLLVMPASFLLIGMAVLASPEVRPLPATFKTYWLIVHIFFAKLAYGSALIGTALAVLYLLKRRRETAGRADGFYERLPSLETLDELSYAFLGFSFVMIGTMILAGSIWAKNAWGRYWGWDAVETWSLVSWLVYGLYLHLRRTYGWKGEGAAYAAVAAMATLLFALFGVGVFFESFHSPYVR